MLKRSLFFLLFVYSSGFWIPLNALALPAAEEALLQQLRRPTVEQIEDLIKQEPQSEYSKAEPLNPGLATEILQTVPAAMAALEAAYPGATFAPLGRDAVIMGDAIDAAYRVLGQNNRVLRVDLSGPSFNSKSRQFAFGLSPEIWGYLNQIGISPEQLVRKNKKLVFGDRTAYTSSSQSSLLLKGLFQKFVAEGGDPKTLFRHLGFVALSPKNEIDISTIQAFFNEFSGDYPKSVLQFKGITDSTAWHDSWKSPLLIGSNGAMSVPGPGASKDSKERVLEDLQTVFQTVRTEAFWKNVHREYGKLGLKFVMPRNIRSTLQKNYEQESLSVKRHTQLKEVEFMLNELNDLLPRVLRDFMFSEENESYRFHCVKGVFEIAELIRRISGHMGELGALYPELKKRFEEEIKPTLLYKLISAQKSGLFRKGWWGHDGTFFFKGASYFVLNFGLEREGDLSHSLKKTYVRLYREGLLDPETDLQLDEYFKDRELWKYYEVTEPSTAPQEGLPRLKRETGIREFRSQFIRAMALKAHR